LVPISRWWLLFDADRKMQLHAILEDCKIPE
jgi:hypothetical protein